MKEISIQAILSFRIEEKLVPDVDFITKAKMKGFSVVGKDKAAPMMGRGWNSCGKNLELRRPFEWNPKVSIDEVCRVEKRNPAYEKN
ncbi:MAG TPA: hypothetical protein DD636_05080 [Anaerolineaceae bacterium]|jgi:hypothetical protein|nr:hypothetical protein [Anaerolineaceae bacterium]